MKFFVYYWRRPFAVSVFATLNFFFLFNSLQGAESQSTYPLWDGVESIDTYAKRVNLPRTRTLDLGNGVSMELVLIPAGSFEMGTPKPQPPSITVTSANFLICVGGASLGALLCVLLLTIYKRRKFAFSLSWLLMLTVAAGMLIGGIARRSLALREHARYTDALVQDAFDRSEEKYRAPRTMLIQSPFYMGKYPVTQKQYQIINGRNPARYTGPNNPVEYVTWKNAIDYCKDLREQLKKSGQDANVQLPSEVQWEFACKAGTQTRYYTGNSESDLSEAAWYRGNGGQTTHPVGEKKPNAFGLYDMHGNVFQWCSEGLDDDVSGGQEHIVRGGSAFCDPLYCRSARTDTFPTYIHYYDVGFRVIVPVP